MSTLLTEFRAVHARSLAFAAALPLVAAVPLVAEFVQHVVEMRIGMYDSPDAAEATADNAQRLNFGFAKVIRLVSLLLLTVLGQLMFNRLGTFDKLNVKIDTFTSRRRGT